MNKQILKVKTMNINHLNLNFMKTSKLFLSALFCLTLITSCSDDDTPTAVLEEELITDVVLTFVNEADASNTVVMSSISPDGQDGASTQTVVGDFNANATYSLNIAITNTSENPADDVLNDDIIPEADEHFFTYGVDAINLTVTRDEDDIAGPDDSKLGVNTTWVAGSASTGSVQIVLTHEPETVNDTNELGTVTGGSQDINIRFTGVEIK